MEAVDEGVRAAQVAIDISDEIVSGVGAETIADLKSGAKVVANLLGLDHMLGDLTDVDDERTLQAMTMRLMRQAIAVQGRAMSDMDAKNERAAQANLSNPAEVNRHLGNIALWENLRKREKFMMEDRIGVLLNNGLLASPLGEIPDLSSI